VPEAEFHRGLPASDNPDLGFVGDVDGPAGRLPPEGYGVHAGPVARRLGELGLPARAERGRDADWLRARLREGKPVVLWVTADLACRPAALRTDRAGRAYRAVAWEHAVLAVGATRDGVRCLDPATGRERVISWPALLPAWAALDGMAVWVPSQSMGVDTRRSP
jgi:hypothetical protein